MAMIEVKNVAKSFGTLTVLKNFSVDFTQEGVTVLLGPSGTGKSTLLRCINGLETIDEGDILVNGRSVKEKKNLREIRLDCGMVFQRTVLFPHLNVMRNLTMSPMRKLGFIWTRWVCCPRRSPCTTSCPAANSSGLPLPVR